VPPRLKGLATKCRWDVPEAEERFFAVIRERDLLVHHPYNSLPPQSCASLPMPPTIQYGDQMTLRTSGDSPIVNALITAAENGKAGGCTGGTEGSL